MMGNSLLKKLLMLMTLTALSATFASGPVQFTPAMKGRLLYVSRGKNAGIWVFDGEVSDGMPGCRKFGSSRSLRLPASEVTLLPFYEEVSSLTVTQWMLYAYAHANRRGWERVLANQIGDTSGRMAMVAEFEIACNSFLGKLKNLPLTFDEDWTAEDYADKVSELWIDNNPLNDIIRKAMAGEDRILAIALLEAYRAFLKEHRGFFTAAPAVTTMCRETMDGLMVEQLTGFNEFKRKPNPRQERFHRLFPRSRSLWCESPPADYDALLSVFDRSLKAFARLDDLSVLTEPEEWGAAMLDTLLMTEGSPAGEELEKEFDSAMGEIEKNTAGAQNVKP